MKKEYSFRPHKEIKKEEEGRRHHSTWLPELS